VGSLLTVYNWFQDPEAMPVAEKGALDASHWDFTERGVILLRGEWEFYQGMLLTPADFNERPEELGKQRKYMAVPGDWKGIMSSGGRDGAGYGTYRLVVKIGRDDVFSLRGKKIRLSNHVYFGGDDSGGSGQPSDQAATYMPSNMPVFATAASKSGYMDILIQVASYNNLRGGLVQPPEFGLTEDVIARRDNSRLVDILLISAMLVFGLYYAGMAKRWRKEPYIMHFSIFCLAIGLFTLIDNEIVLGSFWPDFPFAWLQKLLIMLPFISFLSFSMYAYRYLGIRESRWFRGLRIFGVSYICLQAVLPNSFVSMLFYINIVLQAIIFCVVAGELLLGRRENRKGLIYIVLGGSYFVLAWIIGQIRYQFALDNPFSMLIAPLLLVFSQSFLMSDRFQQAFQKSEGQTKRLMAQNRQKDEFLAKTSRELHTPLNGIIHLSQSLLEDKKNPLLDPHRENIQLLHAVGRRLSTLVDDMMDFNRIKYGETHLKLAPVDVAMMVRFVLNSLAIVPINDRVEIRDELPNMLPFVMADENRLRQILYTLIENGLKYTAEGYVVIRAVAQEDVIVISIEDTGSGMPKAYIDRLFGTKLSQEERELYETDGFGLGIRLVKQLVELHGSELQAISAPGEGTVFSFTLNVAAPEMELQQLYESESAAAEEELFFMPLGKEELESPFTILIVDDDGASLKMMIDVVQSLGYAHVAMRSSEEAVKWLSGSKRPDLAVIDLLMPVVSGLDLCSAIRSRYSLAELPVLMMTSLGHREDIIAALREGANDIIHKPFEPSVLKARIQSLLAMKKSSEQAVKREMDFLQAQITPHFLYNSMNALVGLSYKDTDKLRETIHHLTTYLRAKFTFVFKKKLIPLEHELELVRAYLEIEQLRFGSRLEVQYELQGHKNVWLPPLSLQPIVENAVRHGIGPKPEGGTIRISSATSDEGVRITVADNGVGIEKDDLERLRAGSLGGVGVASVNYRMKTIFGQPIVMRSELGIGTEMELLIPEGFDAESDAD
jgi:two-component system sensor histidine kinase ChiS